MLRSYFVVLYILFVTAAFAQNKVEPDQRLLSIFPQEKLDFLQYNAPRELAFMNFMLENAIEVVQISSVQISHQELPTIKIEDIENLNFYVLKLNQLPDTNNYYIIEDTDLLLSVKSYHYVKELFKKEFYKD